MRHRLQSLFAALMIVVLQGQSAGVPIFVGPQSRDGFVDVDQGVLDSIRDIKGELSKAKEFRVVASPDVATIVLEVVARRTRPSKHRAIESILRVGIYEKAMTSVGQDDDQWNAAAKQVVKDVSAWMRANRVRLIP